MKIARFVTLVLCLVLTCVFICGCISPELAVLLLPFAGEPESNETVFRWIAEESYLIDYEITAENTVKLRCSLRFENKTDEDLAIDVHLQFFPEETRGWMKNADLFGKEENGETIDPIIKAGETRDVIIIFEGEYLGGPVNEDLSFENAMWFSDLYDAEYAYK